MENRNNGVGRYNLAGEYKEYEQQRIPFLSGIDRDKDGDTLFKINDRKSSIRGPGSYRYDSYFDWNKKSYNVLFA